MHRPFTLLPVALIALAPVVAACGSESGAAETTLTASVAVDPDTAKIDQVKAGSFVIGFRSAFPGLSESRDDAAITALFTETCADIRGGKPEGEVLDALRARIGNQVTVQETRTVHEMIAVMCRG
ncbi:hypothetical protein [Nocardia sp. X0981]